MASVNGNNEGGGAAGARVTKFLQWLMALPSEFSAKVVDVMSQIKKVGKEDPRRVIHALKVALSITLVSAFYYVNPLYDGFGSSAMYAVFTVIVVSEFSVGNYRDHEVLDIALKRVISIISGGLISVSVSIFVCPIWAGGDLHNLESKNIEKLGNFLEGFGEEYFGRSEGGESNKLFIQGYKSVLTSKQVEETFANFARWEPCHGRFRFRHPWQQYLKIGNLSRQCAYRIDALNGFLNSAKTPLEMRGKIPDPCIKMSTEAGKALKELAMAIHKMIPPSAANPHIAKSKIAATNLRSIMKTGLWEDTNLFEVIPVLTVASLLLHVVSCTEKLAESIQELSTLAKFKNQDSEFVPKSPQQKETPQPCCHNSGPHHVVTIN
ncbi:Aluminum-activated malate transporter 1 [Glycine soja]|uniref:Aluminum-activated malate transporter 1 n=1 Tax=Glycine soja TaxID=3848 RepID=A0A0B2QDU8_GLYSO|nr:Aluminum-activated malate transporter 1 [Glycine soja]